MTAVRVSRGVQVSLAAAIVANVLGWVLPVIDDYRGWQAFRVAFSPVWPFEQFKLDPGWLMILSVASALTNAVFIGLVAAFVAGVVRTAARARAVLWIAAAAALLNLHWPISMEETRVELEPGYFIWVGSFVLLALAAFFAVSSTVERRR